VITSESGHGAKAFTGDDCQIWQGIAARLRAQWCQPTTSIIYSVCRQSRKFKLPVLRLQGRRNP